MREVCSALVAVIVAAGANLVLPWQLAAQPAVALARDLRIDGDSANLVSIGMLQATPDGGVLVPQRQDASVLRFDSDGKLAGRFGRSGQGPGEFTFVGPAGFVGDSIWIDDPPALRAFIVGPGMKLVRTFDYPGAHPLPAQASQLPTSGRSTLKAVYGDGTMLVSPLGSLVVRSSVPPAGFDTTGRHLFRIAADGAILKYVAHIADGPDRNVSMSSGRGVASLAVPFGTRSLDFVSSRGSRIAQLSVVREGRLANTMRVVMLNAAGDTVYSRNLPFEPERIPPRVADSAKAAVVETQRGRGQSDFAALIQATMKIPPIYAPFNWMLLSDDGALWIRLRRQAGAREDSFIVLDARGNTVGIARSPVTVSLTALSPTHVWGTEADANGVQSIVRFRISAPRE